MNFVHLYMSSPRALTRECLMTSTKSTIRKYPSTKGQWIQHILKHYGHLLLLPLKSGPARQSVLKAKHQKPFNFDLLFPQKMTRLLLSVSLLLGLVHRIASWGHVDPTKGFLSLPLNQSNFDIQRPYDVPEDERYSFKDGVHKLWVFSSDKPHTPTSRTNPRTEIRISVSFRCSRTCNVTEISRNPNISRIINPS